MTITERIMSLINKRNLKASTVADSLGISRSNLTRWKRKEYIPSSEHIIALSQFFGVSTDWLLTGNEELFNAPASKSTGITTEETELLNCFKRLNDTDKIRIIERIKTTVELREEIAEPITENLVLLKPKTRTIKTPVKKRSHK